MSELKDYDIMDIEAMDDARLEKSESGKIQVTRVYIKEKADKVIAKLEEERRWRKFPEEMPEDGAEVLATDGEDIWLCRKDTMCDGSTWFQPDGLPQIEGVTHRLPLPSAPKEQA